MNRSLCGLVILAVVLSFVSDAHCQSVVVVDFESVPVGTSFGSSQAGVSPQNMPGDLIFTENGVGVSVENFTQGTFVALGLATIGGFTDSAFPTTPATISNVRLGFDLSGLAGPVSAASFEFVDFGGSENLVINGSVLELFNLDLAPSSLAGVGIVVTDVPGGVGNVQLTGPITSLEIGGQEFGIDNVTFQVNAVPEPTSIMLLAGAGVGVLLRRRRSFR